MKRLLTAVLVTAMGCSTLGDRVLTEPEQPDMMSEYSLFSTPKGTRIRIRNGVGNKLVFLYDGLNRELPVCLHGRGNEESITISDISLPTYIESTPTSAAMIISECLDKGNYIGLAHNHSNGTCMPSYIDARRLSNDNNALLEVIVCAANKEGGGLGIGFYTKSEVEDAHGIGQK